MNNFERKLYLKYMAQNINRLKIVLAEQKKTARWLAIQMDKDPATISKWCTNTSQPSVETFIRIADILHVDVRELITPTRNDVVLQKTIPLTQK